MNAGTRILGGNFQPFRAQLARTLDVRRRFDFIDQESEFNVLSDGILVLRLDDIVKFVRLVPLPGCVQAMAVGFVDEALE